MGGADPAFIGAMMWARWVVACLPASCSLPVWVVAEVAGVGRTPGCGVHPGV